MAGSGKDKKALDLTEIRTRINGIDERIQTLINERATVAQEVGVAKGKLGSAVDYYRPEREAEVLRNVLERNEGPMRDEEMLRLFREIMSACLAQQKIDEVFQEVECGAADFGVVPIENSTEGSVNNTLDMFLTSPLKIAGEIELRIEQHLMGKMQGLEKIERICAHEQSLAQCRGWLREYLPQVELIGMSSNAAGARRARDEDGTAAIGPEVAADVYELKIMVNNIEDRPDNATRFLVVGRNLLAASGKDKTTILVSTSDTAGGAGVLQHLLLPLAEQGVNMTRIESRPSRRKKWDYVFFIDIEGHAEESPVSDALEKLETSCSLFRVLGAYPKAIG